MSTIEPIGYVVVDRETRKLDWDGEIHPTTEAARASLAGDVGYHDESWKPFEIYDICPVLPGVPEPSDAGEA